MSKASCKAGHYQNCFSFYEYANKQRYVPILGDQIFDNGAENHAHEEQDSCQNNHQKIDNYSSQYCPPFLRHEHDIESDPQGAEDPCGYPE